MVEKPLASKLQDENFSFMLAFIHPPRSLIHSFLCAKTPLQPSRLCPFVSRSFVRPFVRSLGRSVGRLLARSLASSLGSASSLLPRRAACAKANTDPLGVPLMAKSPKNLSIRGPRCTRIISVGIQSYWERMSRKEKFSAVIYVQCLLLCLFRSRKRRLNPISYSSSVAVLLSKDIPAFR